MEKKPPSIAVIVVGVAATISNIDLLKFSCGRGTSLNEKQREFPAAP
jgi:hypothetical protein